MLTFVRKVGDAWSELSHVVDDVDETEQDLPELKLSFLSSAHAGLWL